jgi:hypothetical protein
MSAVQTIPTFNAIRRCAMARSIHWPDRSRFRRPGDLAYISGIYRISALRRCTRWRARPHLDAPSPLRAKWIML